MQAYRGCSGIAPFILKLSTRRGEWLYLWCSCLLLENSPHTNWTEKWMHSRAGLEALERRNVTSPFWDSKSRLSSV